tara:strand:- start:187 stop:570 length:384 start_codon:yes stop_codon:yes gene_type:complete
LLVVVVETTMLVGMQIVCRVAEMTTLEVDTLETVVDAVDPLITIKAVAALVVIMLMAETTLTMVMPLVVLLLVVDTIHLHMAYLLVVELAFMARELTILQQEMVMDTLMTGQEVKELHSILFITHPL